MADAPVSNGITSGNLKSNVTFLSTIGALVVSGVLFVANIQRDAAVDRATLTGKIDGVVAAQATMRSEREDIRHTRDLQFSASDNAIKSLNDRQTIADGKINDLSLAIAKIESRTESILDLLRQQQGRDRARDERDDGGKSK